MCRALCRKVINCSHRPFEDQRQRRRRGEEDEEELYSIQDWISKIIHCKQCLNCKTWIRDLKKPLTPSFSFSIRTFFMATTSFVFLSRALKTSLQWHEKIFLLFIFTAKFTHSDSQTLLHLILRCLVSDIQGAYFLWRYACSCMHCHWCVQCSPVYTALALVLITKEIVTDSDFLSFRPARTIYSPSSFNTFRSVRTIYSSSS